MSHRKIFCLIALSIGIWLVNVQAEEDPHAAVFAESNYPSAI